VWAKSCRRRHDEHHGKRDAAADIGDVAPTVGGNAGERFKRLKRIAWLFSLRE